MILCQNDVTPLNLCSFGFIQHYFRADQIEIFCYYNSPVQDETADLKIVFSSITEFYTDVTTTVVENKN